MLRIGQRATLPVLREAPMGLILDAGECDLLLPTKFVPAGAAIGDLIDVFVYTDSEDRPIATTQAPRAEVGEFACLPVKTVSRVGAFLDWGLDKDLLLPFAAQTRRIRRAGDEVIVRVLLDEISGRPMASAKTEQFLSPPPSDLREGQAVSLLLYEESELGVKAIVDQSFAGLLYLTPGELASGAGRVGRTLTGYVRSIRPDGKVDLSLTSAGIYGAQDARRQLLDAVRAGGDRLPIGDKSSPAEIQEHTGLSKKAFKRAAGALYRERKIAIADDEVTLIAGNPIARKEGPEKRARRGQKEETPR